jgi:hypothetical protein
VSHRADDDIAIGDHSHQPIVFAHRQRTGIDLCHEARRHADGLIWGQQGHVAGHYVADFHRFTSTSTTADTVSAAARQEQPTKTKPAPIGV